MVSNFKNESTENTAVLLPITTKNREVAHQFAVEQTTKEKATQVFYNTLAILAVQSYLEMMDLATDLLGSDSWNPVMRAFDDVADLNIANLGKLECRPLKDSDPNCHIPLEVQDLRLGYVVVKIDDSFKKATLLGFTPQVVNSTIAITDLKPLEALIDHLHELKVKNTKNAHSAVVDLGQWFNHVFSAGWTTVESLLNPEQLIPAGEFRSVEFPPEKLLQLEELSSSCIQRAKLINLGIQLGNDQQVVLLVEIAPDENGSIGVILQVHPTSKNAYLPETLTLKVIESSGEVFMQAQARSKDNFIQLQFSGQPKELFTVQIVFHDAQLTEEFQL